MRKRLPQLLLISYFVAWFAYFAWFWAHAIHIDPDGNVHAGLVNIWGDWAAHFTMGSAIGYRELFLTQSPFLVGARFSYPFLANFLSGLLIRLGVPFFASFVVPSFIFSCGLVIALFYFFRTVFQSKRLAVLASLIFLLNGGLGFVYFGQDVLNSSQPWQTLLNPPHEYTRLDSYHIKWISVIDSMVIPQRAFNLGFPLTLFALALIYQVVFLKQPHRRLLLASVLLGIMPLIHTHSFLAAGFILFFWLLASLVAPKKITKQFLLNWAVQWGTVGLVSLSLAVPIFLYFFAEQTQGFLKWYPGWLAREYQVNWLVFWLNNWGITPLLGLAGLMFVVSQKAKMPRVARFLQWLPFWSLFCLINLILFQPFVWDNTKLLVWAAVGIAGLSAFFLDFLFQRARDLKPLIRIPAIAILTAIFGITIASGTIDAYWDVRTDLHTYQMYTAEEVELAEWARRETPVEAIWLSGDQHNHWLFNLTGRQTLMAYRGWLWTHGYDYLPVEKDVRAMYQTPNRQDLYQKYQIQYVVVGPNEMRVWGANARLFTPGFTLVKQTPNYVIYAVK